MMKMMVISLAVGLLVGVFYGVIRVKSPAPPITCAKAFAIRTGSSARETTVFNRQNASSLGSGEI